MAHGDARAPRRPADQAGRGPAADHRRGAKYLDDLKLPGRRARRDPALAVRARADRRDRRRRARPRRRASSAVFTGKDFEHLNPLPCAWQADGAENHVVTPRALEIDKVTFTGAGVAAVVAETREAAEDALELIDVDWEPLDAVVDAEAATSPTARRRSTSRRRGTSSWTGRAATPTRPTPALAEADVVVRQRLVNQRLIPTPMEARGAAADYDAGNGQLHGLDELAGAARHAPADDGVRVRDLGDEDALHLAARRRRASGRRSSSTPSTCSWPRSPRRSAGR